MWGKRSEWVYSSTRMDAVVPLTELKFTPAKNSLMPEARKGAKCRDRRPHSWADDLSDKNHVVWHHVTDLDSLRSPNGCRNSDRRKGCSPERASNAKNSGANLKHSFKNNCTMFPCNANPLSSEDSISSPSQIQKAAKLALKFDNEGRVSQPVGHTYRTTLSTDGQAGNFRGRVPVKRRPQSMVAPYNDFEFLSLTKPQVAVLPPLATSSFKKSRGKHRSTYHVSEPKGGKCRDCMTRIPYATLIATVMCCVGVGVFCGTMYRGTTLTLRMFEEVFKFYVTWVEPVQLTFMIVGAVMGGLGLMILFLGCLSTGETRGKVYRSWRGRVGGRVTCAVFMGITYLLSVAWLLILCSLIVATFMYTMAWMQCETIPQNQCIDYNQFSFLFPPGTSEEDKRVCREERKVFCKDYVNNAEVMFILACVASFLVILSLIHYLMCLSANYAHIKDQEKFIDLQEIQYLQESEMSTLPKDRY